MSRPPTEEQEAILEAFDGGEDICIEAGAGCGKTTSLDLIARRDLELSGLFLAFNRGIAQDARKKLPGTTACMTSHSLAMRSGMGDRFRERIDSGAVGAKELSEWLGIKRFFPGAPGRKDVSNWKTASIARDAVRRFCQSDDDELCADHVPHVMSIAKDRQYEYKRFVLPFARRIWDDVCSDQPQLALGSAHLDHALKLYALSRPALPYDFLMVDEAQDTNGVLAGLVRRQSENEVQVIVVGDSSQQMYRWRGAGDFLTEFKAPNRLSLTQSFRFGPEIAHEANNWLRYIDAPIRLRGLDSIASEVGVVERPRAVLCRTNAQVVEQVMAAHEAGVEVGILKDASAIVDFAIAAEMLQRGQSPQHRELGSFERWSDVQTYVIEEEPGGSFGTYVRLVDRYGPDRVRAAAEGCVPVDRAERVVGTVHSCKGLEWDSVLVDSGVIPESDDPTSDSGKDDLKICYVAVTRAKLQLGAPGMSGYHRVRGRARQTKMRRAMIAA